MKVSLISYTQPSPELLERFRRELGDENFELKDLEDLIVFCARVSNPSNQNNFQSGEKLLKYLIKNKHWSPFEMVDVTLEVETTRDISHQMIRHKSFSFQEFSGRYADMNHLGFEIRECRIQDPKNRQNSSNEAATEADKIWWKTTQEEIITTSMSLYNAALRRGIAKEVARAILPEGLTKTRLYAKNSLRGWIHYLQVRSTDKGGAQKEHIAMARECAKVIAQVFPHIEGFITEGS